MNKKWLAAILTVAIAGTCAAGIAACKTNDGGHTHDFEGVELTPIVENDGTSEYHSLKCKVAGCKQNKGMAKHTYDNGAENKASTCLEAGNATYTCTECGYSYVGDLPLAEHTWGEWSVAEGDEPTDSKTGTAKRTCTVNGCTADDTLTIPKLSEGGFTTEVIKAADCTTDGTAKYTYSNGADSVSFNVTVPKGHKYVAEFDTTNWALFTATLTCENCTDISVEFASNNAENKITMSNTYVQPTCQKEGSTTWTGTFEYDGHTFSDNYYHVVETVDHIYGKWASDENEHWKICSWCGEKDETSVETHSYETKEVTKHPTATEQGEKLVSCKCKEEKTVSFDGVESDCEISSLFTIETNMQGVEISQTQILIKDGKYYHLRDGKTIYFGFTATVADLELYYSTDGNNYSAVPAFDFIEEYPVSHGFDSDNDRHFIRIHTDSEIQFKANIYVTDESIAVVKQFAIAPVPELDTPKAYVYNESNFAYGWADIADTTVYLGQDYKIKAAGYNVTVGEQIVTLNAQGNGTFTPTAAGKYAVTVASPYNAKNSYTANLTVKEAVDTTVLLSGTYAGGDYTVAFGEDNSITVSKDGADDILLTYTYADGVFATAGSDTVSIKLTPTYKLFIVVGAQKTELIKTGATADEIYEILGGTSWTKDVVSLDSNVTTMQYLISVTVTYNADGTGSIKKYSQKYRKGAASGDPSQTTYNFTYTAEEIDNYYKLNFTFVSAVDGNDVAMFEVGGAGETNNYYTSNDFSIINKDSKVTVDGETVSLTLWLLTGHYNSGSCTEQTVTFEKVVAE